MAVETDWPALRPAPKLNTRPKVRALQFPAVSGTLLVQLGGGAATLVGVWLMWGMAVVLIVGGLALTVLGALREAGRV